MLLHAELSECRRRSRVRSCLRPRRSPDRIQASSTARLSSRRQNHRHRIGPRSERRKCHAIIRRPKTGCGSCRTFGRDKIAPPPAAGCRWRDGPFRAKAVWPKPSRSSLSRAVRCGSFAESVPSARCQFFVETGRIAAGFEVADRKPDHACTDLSSSYFRSCTPGRILGLIGLPFGHDIVAGFKTRLGVRIEQHATPPVDERSPAMSRRSPSSSQSKGKYRPHLAPSNRAATWSRCRR